MSFLLDTDHISLLQRPASAEHPRIVAHMSANVAAGVAMSVVSFQEQTGGANARINSARTPAVVLDSYQLLLELYEFYQPSTLVPFDAPAQAEFDRLRAAGVRVGTLDLRLAAIALCRNLTVVTRNARDFGRVPGLRTDDWTR